MKAKQIEKQKNKLAQSESERSYYCSCLVFSSNALSRVLTEMADNNFSKLGLTSSAHAFILMTVNRRPGITIGDIAKTHLLAPSTVSRLTEKLELQGWLRREPDKRIVRVFPKKKGLDLQADLEKCWAGIFNSYSFILGKNEGQKLTEDITNAYYALIAKEKSESTIRKEK